MAVKKTNKKKTTKAAKKTAAKKTTKAAKKTATKKTTKAAKKKATKKTTKAAKKAATKKITKAAKKKATKKTTKAAKKAATKKTTKAVKKIADKKNGKKTIESMANIALSKLDSKTRELVKYASTWWGREWIRAMLTYGKFYRMQRAVRYAKEGRIHDVIIEKGSVFALCDGTAPVPYRVRLNFKPLSSKQWNSVIHDSADEIIQQSQLLVGEIPEKMIQFFYNSGVPLFPPPSKSLNASCNCPDKEVPCKHIASLILTLAKIFDYDPFLLFKLRGMEKDEILNGLDKISIKLMEESPESHPSVSEKSELGENINKQLQKQKDVIAGQSLDLSALPAELIENAEDEKEFFDKNDDLSKERLYYNRIYSFSSIVAPSSLSVDENNDFHTKSFNIDFSSFGNFNNEPKSTAPSASEFNPLDIIGVPNNVSQPDRFKRLMEFIYRKVSDEADSILRKQ